MSTLGLEASRALAHELRERAHVAIAPFGSNGWYLGQLADLIVHRSH
ncbi:hypothetical protein ACFJIS_11850 [Variovorax boronicumulans]